MRSFFKSELETLKAKTGLNQYETFSNMPDAPHQIKILLDSMILVCQEFHFIPDEDKKRIIREMITRDQEFTGLNSRVIWRWLNAKKDQYYKELAHREAEAGEPPLTGEARDKAIQEYLNAILQVDNNFKVSNDKYSEIRAQWNPEAKKYQPLSSEQVRIRKAHVEYVRAMQAEFGTDDTKWPDEMDWIEKNLI